LNASLRAMVAAFNTHTSASTGVIGWVIVDYIKYKKKFSVIGACEGAIAGLVGTLNRCHFLLLRSTLADSKEASPRLLGTYPSGVRQP
jgi:ammonia channel protein AmtB